MSAVPGAKQGKKAKAGLSEAVRVALEDVAVTHIMHLPISEFETPEQLCWSLQNAHWFYLDELCSQDAALPAFSFPEFLKLIVAVVPGLEHLQNDVPRIVAAFGALKFSLPVFGAILLTAGLDKVLLVKEFGPRAAWTWPKGKLEKQDNEDPFACAQREVFEETSYDISELGVNSKSHFMERVCNGKQVGLFIVEGVDESFPFAPRCRGEIAEYAWFNVSDLPRGSDVGKTHVNLESRLRYFHVHNFSGALVSWIDNRLGRKPRNARAPAAVDDGPDSGAAARLLRVSQAGAADPEAGRNARVRRHPARVSGRGVAGGRPRG